MFFSTCLLASAREARDSMRKLVDLHSETERLIREKAGRATTNALMLLDLLEGNPIVDTAFVSERMQISRSSANNLISQFTDWGILVQRDTSRKRYRTFSYEPYLAILRTGDEPL